MHPYNPSTIFRHPYNTPIIFHTPIKSSYRFSCIYTIFPSFSNTHATILSFSFPPYTSSTFPNHLSIHTIRQYYPSFYTAGISTTQFQTPVSAIITLIIFVYSLYLSCPSLPNSLSHSSTANHRYPRTLIHSFLPPSID